MSCATRETCGWSPKSRLSETFTLTEADLETAALAWLSGVGWWTARPPDIAPHTSRVEWAYYGQVALERRLGDALARLNPRLSVSALDDSLRRLAQSEGTTLEAE